MSTEYTTLPTLTFDEVLTCNLYTFELPIEARYTTRQRLMCHPMFGKIWLFEWEDVARFERVGQQNVDILDGIANYFKVEIIDEYGVPLPPKG